MAKKKDYDTSTGQGQKRLMYESIGIDITQKPQAPSFQKEGEYGHDPILDAQGNPTGKIRMVPTGRIVDVATGKEVPYESRPCVGCGYCCIKARCAFSTLFDEKCTGPLCPFLHIEDGIFRCKLAERYPNELNIGVGCSSVLNSQREQFVLRKKN